jgi:hypothetical protein
VISALVSAFVSNIESDERVSEEITQEIRVAVGSGASFVAADDVEDGLRSAGVDDATTSAVVEDYRAAQLGALKSGLLLAGFIALGALLVTHNLPARPLGREAEPAPPDAVPRSS